MAQIKKLDVEFRKHNVSVSGLSLGDGGTNHHYSPYELYGNIVNDCQNRYERDESFSTGDDKNLSQKSLVQGVSSRLTEFVHEKNTFSSELINEITDQVLNCSDNSAPLSGSCTNGTLQTSGESFCLKTAMSCAQNVSNCAAIVESEIQVRENKIKTLAVQYNQNVENFVTSQEAYFNTIKEQVKFEAGYLASFFGGANFEMPEKLFVGFPELQEEGRFGLGVKLRGDELMSFLDNRPGAIKKLKGMIADQQGEINSKIEQHISEQEEVLHDSIAVWDELIGTCTNSEKQYAASVTKQNQEMKKQYDEMSGDLNKFCQKYDSLRRSQVPGCDGDNSPASLMELSEKISGQVRGNIQVIGQYQDICNSIENDSNLEGSEGNTNDDRDAVVQACDYGLDETVADLEADFFDKLSSSDKSAVEDYLDSDSRDDLESIKSTRTRRTAIALRKLKKDSKLTYTPISKKEILAKFTSDEGKKLLFNKCLNEEGEWNIDISGCNDKKGKEAADFAKLLKENKAKTALEKQGEISDTSGNNFCKTLDNKAINYYLINDCNSSSCNFDSEKISKIRSDRTKMDYQPTNRFLSELKQTTISSAAGSNSQWSKIGQNATSMCNANNNTQNGSSNGIMNAIDNLGAFAKQASQANSVQR